MRVCMYAVCARVFLFQPKGDCRAKDKSTEGEWDLYQQESFWTQYTYVPLISAIFCGLVFLIGEWG